MEKFLKFIVIFIVAFIVLYFGRKFLVQQYTKKLVQSVGEDEEVFNKTLNGLMVKMLFPPFNRDFLRLNYYIAHEDDSKVDDLCEDMVRRNLNKKQEFSVLQTVFQYYLMQKNGRKTKKYQKQLLSFFDKYQFDQGFKDDVNLNVRIQIDGDIKTLSAIDKNIKRTEENEKATWYIKKAYVLKCNDQLSEAKECIKKAIEATNQPLQKSMLEKILADDLKAL